MRYGSVCSGIEAATVAWHPLGWEPAWFSEIDKFPSAVLAHHYPGVPNLGDMTRFKEWPLDPAIDVLVGGTPCQSFSVAGLRKGLADPRGNLMLTFGAIAGRYRPKWLVWENVPGVLSSHGGRDFGTFLGMLGECGYGFAYRVLDAQYFGLAQRRKRVFVVAHLGDWRPAAAVLFERQSLQGHPAPSREAGERVAPTIAADPPFSRTGNERVEAEAMVPVAIDRAAFNQGANALYTPQFLEDGSSQTITAKGPGAVGIPQGFGGGEDEAIPISSMAAISRHGEDRIGIGIGNPGDPCSTLSKAHHHAVAIHPRGVGRDEGGPEGKVWRDDGASFTMDTTGGGAVMAFAQNTRDEVREMNVIGALSAQPGMKQTSFVRNSMAVRRLTPRECERLQGFPDDYTLIQYRGKDASDGPRYKALGNSMAVPVMAWIGKRIQKVTDILGRTSRHRAGEGKG